MKRNALFVMLALLVCMAGLFVGFKPAHVLVNRSAVKNVNPAIALQIKVQPFCKLTLVDHRGHSEKLSTNLLHASSRSLTFIFDSGEKLVISFTTLRVGHFVAESARSKDPQIIFYPAHSQHAVPMVGAVIISGVKPVTGNFSHLVSDSDDHMTLVAGTFSF